MANMQEQTIIGMLASHVRSDAQADELALCLASITAQSVKPYVMLVSWSAETAEMTQRVQEALRKTDPSGEFLVALHQREAHSQFEHFDACRVYVERAIVSRGRPADSIWCLFSDDDDLWHPERCKRYFQFLLYGIKNHPAKVAELRSLRCIPYVTDADTHSDTHHGETVPALRECPRHAADVNDWLGNGRARLHDGTSSTTPSENLRGEYWQWCVTILTAVAALLLLLLPLSPLTSFCPGLAQFPPKSLLPLGAAEIPAATGTIAARPSSYLAGAVRG